MRAEIRNRVVGALDGTVGARRANGEGPWGVAWSGDAAVLGQARRVLAKVARRGDDHNSAVDDALGRERERIGPERLVDGRGDRHVDDADPVFVVMRDDPVERCDDVADRAETVRVENLERDEAGVWSDARLLTARVAAIASDDAGHVRAVSVVVVRGRPAVDEIDERRDALITEWIQIGRAVRQIVVPLGDAGIDERDADAGARQTESLVHRPRADGHRGAVVGPGDRTIEIDPEYRRIGDELREDGIRDGKSSTVDDREVTVFLFCVRPEFGWKLRAGLKCDDNARRFSRLQRGSRGELAIELATTSLRVWLTGGAPLRGCLMPSLRQCARHEAEQHGDEKPTGAPRSPHGLTSAGYTRKADHGVILLSKVAARSTEPRRISINRSTDSTSNRRRRRTSTNVPCTNVLSHVCRLHDYR